MNQTLGAQLLGQAADSRLDSDELANRMLTAYSLDCGVNKTGESGIPSNLEVERMTLDLLSVLFPGYLEAIPEGEHNVGEYVARRLSSFSCELRTIIKKAVGEKEEGKPCRNSEFFEIEVDAKVQRFLQKLPTIRRNIALDVKAAFDGDPAAKSCEEVVCCYPSIIAVSVHRVAHELYLMNVPIVPRMMSEFAHKQTGIDIHPGAEIGSRFFIDHGTGTVIGETARIGNNVRLYQGVTLGALSLPRKNTRSLAGVKRHPTLEDDVIVYSGATILGGNTVIGKGSIIGGNVWITESVPPGSKVVLVRPRTTHDSNLESGWQDFSI